MTMGTCTKKLYAFTVFTEVIPLWINGLRLRIDEWPAPQRGRLAMSHVPYPVCAARRTLREAKLMGWWVSTPKCLLSMFDPEFGCRRRWLPAARATNLIRRRWAPL